MQAIRLRLQGGVFLAEPLPVFIEGHDEDAEEIEASEGEESMKRKRCPRCREKWPLEPDFFRRIRASGRIRWQSWCRACEAEWIAQKRKKDAVA